MYGSSTYHYQGTIVPPVAFATAVMKVPDEVNVWIVFPPDVVTVPPVAFLHCA
jgi:hypothetical protein